MSSQMWRVLAQRYILRLCQHLCQMELSSPNVVVLMMLPMPSLVANSGFWAEFSQIQELAKVAGDSINHF
jgi:hypothetical protein